MDGFIKESLDVFKSLPTPLLETLYIVLVSTIGAVMLGIVPAILLLMTKKNGLKPNKAIFAVLDFIVNTLRSFPFVILITVLIPITRFITGSSIGTNAVIVPLIIGAAPFVTRIIENALNEVDRGVVEAAKAFAANNRQIFSKVLFKEAVPALISGLTLTIIVILGYSAMAGVVGGGGIGDYAIRYGYQRNNPILLLYTVISLVIIVQIIQSTGNYLYKKSIR